MSKGQCLNKKCKELFEDIEFTQCRLKWNFKTLCKECFCQMDYDEDILDDPGEEKKYYERYKKIFSRKSWEQGKATKQTLIRLQELRDAIHKTDKYGKIDMSVKIPTKSIELLKKTSEELERKLKQQDYD